MRSEVTDRPGTCPAPRLHGQIVFQNVWFEYVSGQPVLSDIHLNIPPGEKLAIVAATGAGKSTLVSLVARFYDPCDGTICIDGLDYPELHAAVSAGTDQPGVTGIVVVQREHPR